MSTLVERNEDISQIQNGEFIFCKELSKGMVKKDISSLGSITFEAVVNEIEALPLDILNTLGLDSVIFGDNYSTNKGEILISHKIEEMIKDKTSLMNTTNTNIFIANEKNKTRYFDVEKLNNIPNNFSSIYELSTPLDCNGTADTVFDTGISQASLGSTFALEITFTRSNDISGFQGLIGLHGGSSLGIALQNEAVSPSNYTQTEFTIGAGDGGDWANTGFAHIPCLAGSTHKYLMIVEPTKSQLFVDGKKFSEINRDGPFAPIINSNVLLGTSHSGRYFKGTINGFNILKP